MVIHREFRLKIIVDNNGFPHSCRNLRHSWETDRQCVTNGKLAYLALILCYFQTDRKSTRYHVFITLFVIFSKVTVTITSYATT